MHTSANTNHLATYIGRKFRTKKKQHCYIFQEYHRRSGICCAHCLRTSSKSFRHIGNNKPRSNGINPNVVNQFFSHRFCQSINPALKLSNLPDRITRKSTTELILMILPDF